MATSTSSVQKIYDTANTIWPGHSVLHVVLVVFGYAASACLARSFKDPIIWASTSSIHFSTFPFLSPSSTFIPFM